MSDAGETWIRSFLRRAAQTETPLLVTSLRRYAAAEGLSWEELARSLGCGPDALDQVALCRPPREESFVRDVEAIAAEHVDPNRLLPLLRRLQVLGTLACAPAPDAASSPDGAFPPVTGRVRGSNPPLFVAGRAHEGEEAEEGDPQPAGSGEEPAPRRGEADEGDGRAPGEAPDG